MQIHKLHREKNMDFIREKWVSKKHSYKRVCLLFECILDTRIIITNKLPERSEKNASENIL